MPPESIVWTWGTPTLGQVHPLYDPGQLTNPLLASVSSSSDKNIIYLSVVKRIKLVNNSISYIYCVQHIINAQLLLPTLMLLLMNHELLYTVVLWRPSLRVADIVLDATSSSHGSAEAGKSFY